MLKIINDVRNVVFLCNKTYGCTHWGKFHADEVFASIILELYYGELYILRVKDVPDKLPPNVIVYDIGYGEFDHHQYGGNGIRSNGVPYASAGLIWKKFGPSIIRRTRTREPELVWEWIDRELIQSIDAIDCGAMPKTIYPTKPYTVSTVIGNFNPPWNSNMDANRAFIEACNFARIIFNNVLSHALGKAESKDIVDKAIEDSQNHIMVLPEHVPWQEWFFNSPNEKTQNIWFVVYPSNRGGYNFQCIPSKAGEGDQRKAVPKAWRGISADALRRVTGVSDATFVHSAGFLGGAESFEGAMKMATMLSSA